jgi:hypothetical protein
VTRPLAAGFYLKNGGEELGNVGVKTATLRSWGQFLINMGCSLVRVHRLCEGLSYVGRAQCCAGYVGARALIYKNLVVRIAAVAGWDDDLDAVSLERGKQGAECCRPLIQGPVDALTDGGKIVGWPGAG